MERGGQSHYYHTDGLGSIIALTDIDKDIIQSYNYDSFGNIVESTGSLTNPYTYTARELDLESGIYFYRARYYDPSVGRFLQEDVFPIFLRFPQTLNPYPYTINNPLCFIDPWGWCEEEPAIDREKLFEILEMERRLGTWETLAYYSFGEASGVNVRLKDGRIVDLQYTIDIGWASKTGPASPVVFTIGWEIGRRIPHSPIGWSEGLSDKANREGWKAGWQFYPFSPTRIRDIIDPNYLQEIGFRGE